MLKKIMLPVVLFFMLLSTCVVVKAADSTAYLDIIEGMSYEDIYNYMIDYAVDNGHSSRVNSYTYAVFKDFTIGSNSRAYMIFLSDGPFVVKGSSNNLYGYNNLLEITFSRDGTISVFKPSSSVDTLSRCFDVIYCNHDICDSSGNVFLSAVPFPVPQVVLGVETEELAAMIQPEAVLKEVTAVLPMILVFLGGYLALRKALEVLREILSRA